MKNNKKYLLIASYVVLLLIIGVLVYLNFFTSSDSKTKLEKEKPAVTNEKEANEYLEGVPFFNSTTIEPQFDAYSGHDYTTDTIPKKTIVSLALMSTEKRPFTEENKPKVKRESCGEGPDDECTGDGYYHIDDVNLTLKKLYNIENVKADEIPLPGGVAYYFEPYYVSFYGAGAGSITKFNTINSMTKNNGEIIIEENACFLVMDIIQASYFSSTDFEKSQIKEFIGVNSSSEQDFDNAIENAKEYYTKNKDKCNTFTHVFKTRPDGNPYWYSTKVNR